MIQELHAKDSCGHSAASLDRVGGPALYRHPSWIERRDQHRAGTEFPVASGWLQSLQNRVLAGEVAVMMTAAKVWQIFRQRGEPF